ncbi:uncharacterized protein MELLADRAFT_73569 [Melampsora larici-populina 98AG31]|uniref:Uncharacterized protein MlpSTE3.2 n=2 Tax=Melampsora laricis-populina TaxID=203908 RepID=F4S9P9_MELLP|nr:uncharacterized protein MELLADRAFT_73569 [Melampsora larici-populina 98AG31]EGF98614.1 hypothetical protein MELLADRAFT_73569 [Melampsora larici-populina 98AG31]
MTSDAVINTYLSLSLLCALINIAPTCSHLTQGHSGPGAFGIWVVLLNTFGFVNGVIWRSDAINRSPIFCDISMRIFMVGPMGLLMANLCIIRYLSSVVTPNRVVDGKSDKRKRLFLDYLLCLGFPLVLAGVAVIYQAGRFEVNRLAGCSNISALVWPTFVLSIIWPPIICGVSCGYSLYVMYWLARRHHNLKQLLGRSSSPLNMSRFTRMGAFSATYFLISAPVTAYGTHEIIVASGPYIPWESWATVHNSWNKLSDVRQNPLYQYQLRDWLSITAGLVLFVFFSFGGEASLFYLKIFHWICPGKFARIWKRKTEVLLPIHASAQHSEKKIIQTNSSQSSFTTQERHEATRDSCSQTNSHLKNMLYLHGQPTNIRSGQEAPGILVSVVQAESSTLSEH